VPEEFEESRNRLFDQLVLLDDAWATYRYLFGTSQERVRILNACAHWYFALTQRLLLAETILGISRLTDRPTTAGQENLVLDRLLEDPALEERTTLKAGLAAAIADARAAAAPIRAHRHKYVAHLDRDLAIGKPEEPLPGLSRESITAVIQKLQAVYNLHGNGLRRVDTSFELHPLAGADALLHILEASERWKLMREVSSQPRKGRA
jgi:hypothetical protein